MKRIVLIICVFILPFLPAISKEWIEIFKNRDSDYINPWYKLQLAINSKNEIYVLGHLAIDTSIVFHKTVNECKTWIKLNTPSHSLSNHEYFQKIKINSQDDIFIAFDSILVCSKDDGFTFDTILNQQKLEGFLDGSLIDFSFRGFNISPNGDLFLNLISAGFYNSMLKSTDEGITWYVVNSNSNSPCGDIFFDEVWVVFGVQAIGVFISQ